MNGPSNIGNSAFLYISVAFIQMLKALMPVAVFLVAVLLRTEALKFRTLGIMILISVGVAITAVGQININIAGLLFQLFGIVAEALRLVLTQVLLQSKGVKMNPITSLYYISPACFIFLGILSHIELFLE